MKIFYLVIFALLSSDSIFCQQPVEGKITIRVSDENKSPMGGVTVNLLYQKDSSLVKIAITEQDGTAGFEGILPGIYMLLVTHASYEKYFSGPVSIDEKNNSRPLGDIILTRKTKQMKEVTVQSQKPFIEKQIDRIVVNVENSIVSAGSTAMEVLERSPGVVIDRNDNISLKGKQAVTIMINGKPSGISGSDLANYLRGLPSSAISKIEIITNPSAKYDAEGNAGIINIILKKDQRMGMNGSISANYDQGFYPKKGAGFSFNYRNKNLNFFGSYNYSYRDSYSNLNLFRRFLENGNITEIYDQSNFIEFLFKTHVYRSGIDYRVSKKTTLDVVVNGLENKFSSYGTTHTDVLDGQDQKQSYNNNFSSTLDTLRNYEVNLNLKHTFDSSGRELTFDLDYARYHNTDGQRFVTDYYKLNGAIASPENIVTGDVNGRLDIKSVKADYAHPLKKNLKLETGAKSSIVTADNDLKYYDASSGTPVYDPGQSNHFIYKENINAAYLTLSKEYKKFSAQLGLRTEQTNVSGDQVSTGQKFDTSYIKFFPSVFLNYTLSPNHSLGLSVSRRLDRPNYRQLNPFRFYINNSTYEEGNPFLQPQFTYSFELSHTYKQKITTTLSYSITRNNIIEVLIPSTTQDKITIQTNKNLAEFDYYGLSVSAPVQITKWWNSIDNFDSYYGFYKGDLANTSISNGKLTFNFNSNNTFILGTEGVSIELNGFYQSRELYAYMDVRPFGMLSTGIQKTVFKKKGNVKLNVADIFHSNGNKATNSYRDYIEDFVVKRDSRVITVALTYHFGNTKIAAARRMTGGAEEEKNRAK